MAIIKPVTSALFLTASRPLTSEQVDNVRAEVARQLPGDTTVVVVPQGFTFQPVDFPPAMFKFPPVDFDTEASRTAVLIELQRIRKTIVDGIQAFANASIGVSHER